MKAAEEKLAQEVAEADEGTVTEEEEDSELPIVVKVVTTPPADEDDAEGNIFDKVFRSGGNST